MEEEFIELEVLADTLSKLNAEDNPYKLVLMDEESQKIEKFIFIDSHDVESFGVSELDDGDPISAVYEGDVSDFNEPGLSVFFMKIVNNPIVLLPEPIRFKRTTENDIEYIRLKSPKLLKLDEDSE